MLIERSPEIRPSEITPKELYLNRRSFLAALPLAGTALARTALADNKLSGIMKSGFSTSEKVTPYKDVTHYNNYYEFGTGKDQPASLAQRLKTSPWTIKVEGAVKKPQNLRHRRHHEDGSARGTDLSPSLRGNVVDRSSMDRLPVECAHQQSR